MGKESSWYVFCEEPNSAFLSKCKKSKPHGIKLLISVLQRPSQEPITPTARTVSMPISAM